MKKFAILLLCMTVGFVSTMKADNDKPISFEQLPAQSKELIKKHFANQSIALVKLERDFFEKKYEVILTNGNKVEFDSKGAWKEIDCKYREVPPDLIPKQITDFVKKNYPDLKITKIEKKSRNRHEVELINDLELEFDANFNLIDIDD